MNATDVRTNVDIGQWLADAGGQPVPLTTTALDEPVWLGRFGGDRQPAIVITAGSHADEIAGVFAALELARTIRIDHAVYIIPCRDPLGWNGFAATLRRVAPESGSVSKHDEAVTILRAHDVLYDDGTLVIARVGGLAFASEPTGAWISTHITRHKLPALLAEDHELATTLRNTRILVPGNVEANDGRTPYSYGGHTAYVGEGYGAHLNRFFDRGDGPVEVAALRQFVDQIRPGLTLDLHEGFSSHYYLFLHPASTAETCELAQVMIDAVRASGGQIADRSELEPVWGPRTSAGIMTVAEGIFTLGEPSASDHASFAGYCDQFGISLTTEPGMEADVSHRTQMIEVGAQAVITEFVRRRKGKA